MAKKHTKLVDSFSPLEELTYEEAFEELNAVVEKLENEDLSLEEALTYFERGQSLAEYCAKLLDQTELKVEQIVGEDMVNFDLNDKY